MTCRTSPPRLRRAGVLAGALLLSHCLCAQQPPAPTHREQGALVYEGIPPGDPALAARLERYLNSRSATFLDWMADGSLLIKTRFGDTEQLHRVAAAGAAREQLTFDPDPIEWARAARNGSWRGVPGGQGRR